MLPVTPLLALRGGQYCLEHAALPPKIALALALEHGDPAGDPDDVGRLCELDVGGAVPEAVDAQAREGDEVLRGAQLGGRGDGEG